MKELKYEQELREAANARKDALEKWNALPPTERWMSSPSMTGELWNEYQGSISDLYRLTSDRPADLLALLDEIERLRECLTAIVDYEPTEVVKDDFAYDRMVESYREAARNGLGRE